MYQDRRRTSANTAVAVARAYEEQVRHAELIDVSAGDVAASAAIRTVLDRVGVQRGPQTLSADLLSETAFGLRIIELKGRGSSGPISLPERELDTLTAAGEHGWLYVVWNTTQPGPYRLWLIEDARRLDWMEFSLAIRPRGATRGVGHEATFQVDAASIERVGTEADLTGLNGLPSKA